MASKRRLRKSASALPRSLKLTWLESQVVLGFRMDS